MTRKYAINYTLTYLNTMASFLQSHQGDTPGKTLPISTLNLVYNVQQNQTVSKDNKEEYKNLTTVRLPSIISEFTTFDFFH